MKKEITNLKQAVVNDVKKESKNSWLALGIVWIIILYALFVPPPAEARVSAELNFGSKLIEVQDEYSDLYLLQKSIAICEGWFNEGSLARRNNNPGNLKAGGKVDSQRHTIYSSVTQGYLAHLSLLQRRYWKMTPKQMNKRYATDPNWHKCVNFYYYGY
ncbi:MAG: glucosaminidase domain-containing protein [Candidatus Brocadiaceae bacterium]|nr:glucosaminidase domain-containing protein [Candidatus Brocadiaceae bacterium]